MVSQWLKASELEDDEKNVILSLSLEYMNIGLLVEVLDKFDTELNV